MIQVSALLCLPFACLCFLCPGGLLIWIGAFPCGFCRRFFVCFYWITGCPACRTTGRGGVGKQGMNCHGNLVLLFIGVKSELTFESCLSCLSARQIVVQVGQ